MKSLTFFVAVAFVCAPPALVQQVDPRLLEARKVWENYKQFKAKSESDQAAEYRRLKGTYALFQSGDLSAIDRLGKQAANLRCAYLDMPQVSLLAYEDGIRRSLTEFHEVIRAAKGAVERIEGYEVLAVQYGVNVAAPSPPLGLIEDVIQSAILTSIRLPGVGRTYGAALRGILNDALPLYPPEERRFLKAALFYLVEVDDGNIAGTSRLYSELQKLDGLLAGALVSDPDNVDRLKQELAGSVNRWKVGLRNITVKCNGLLLVEQYAERLETAAKKAETEKVREELSLGSLFALRDTLAESYSSCSGSEGIVQLQAVQAKLLNRLLDWGYAQWIRALSAQSAKDRVYSLESLTRLLTSFVDDSSEFLQKEQQALLHAYLAQAYTLLAEDKKAMAHYEKAKYVLPISQLEQLAKQRSALGIH